MIVFIKEKSKLVTLSEFQETLCRCSRATFTLRLSTVCLWGWREGGRSASFHLFSLLSDAHLEFQVHIVYLSAGTSPLEGFGSPRISISCSFQSRNPVQIYNTGRNLTCPLAKWLHQRASLVETEQVCQNNTAWKTPRTPEEKKNVTMAQRTFFFLLGCEFPPSNYSSEEAQRQSSSHYKEGRRRRGTPDSRIPNPQFSRDLK